MEGNSLFFLSDTNYFRHLTYKLCKSSKYEALIITCILISTFSLFN